jgi:hypothetical protein
MKAKQKEEEEEEEEKEKGEVVGQKPFYSMEPTEIPVASDIEQE